MKQFSCKKINLKMLSVKWWPRCLGFQYTNYGFQPPTDTINHYDDVIMTTLASQISSLAIVYSIVHSDADQRKHQSSASLAFVRGIHRGPVNSPHKGPVTRKMFPFDDVIMWQQYQSFLIIVIARGHENIDYGPQFLTFRTIPNIP